MVVLWEISEPISKVSTNQTLVAVEGFVMTEENSRLLLISRRYLFTRLPGIGLIALLPPAVSITSCRARTDAQLREDSGEAASLRDIKMLGYSAYSGDLLGENGLLKAEVIEAAKQITLPYIQDDHGHMFNLSPENFAAIKSGTVVEVMTTEAQGHHHKVVIDPANVVIRDHANGGSELDQQIQTILDEHCGECHHPGRMPDLSKFPLEASPHEIQAVINSGSMPPAPRDRLTQSELAAIEQWVKAKP